MKKEPDADSALDSALIGGWLLRGQHSYNFRADGTYISAGRSEPVSSNCTWSTKNGRIFRALNGQTIGSARYKIKGKGASAKLTITNDGSPGFATGTYEKQE